ncbi:probable beta-1,4-xylosyltransferase IRX9H [Chenopodium quinoa]|uniref:Glycosyltransferases n=1 Tax=Chenopodium quinoa TaxID=63459 RepID=A0A803LBR5_CHEQI|nr:probable beta-1,4-xylosyltransferase IRX9H [Chenopodium quinoa]XP_021739188.1 probable beta-1,4-xylosyltransferase IRX9H [Chenopodium quinoa]
MASIRRTLSPVPRPGSRSNGEACSVASPLSKSSSAEKNPLQPSGLSYSSFNSLEYALYRVHNFVLGLFSHRSSRSLDRSKSKGHVWKRAILHFSVFFLFGVFIGLTPFGTSNFPGRIMPQHQTLFFDMIPSAVRYHSVSARNVSSIDETQLENHTSIAGTQDIENATLQEQHQESKVQMERMASETLTVKSDIENPPLEARKLLIVVTPTYPRPFQAYYLNRLAQTLKLVPPPLVWIVIEMNSQSAETTQILRKTGLMYRHLVCNKNITDVRDRYVHQRNVALAHIETHRLDGIVYFADDVNVYSLDLFAELRQIRRFGTWKLAKLSVIRGATFHDGPVCNGSQIIGWKTDEMTRRFHVDNSGFAFNSTILWDPKRWHRPILEPIRQLDTVEEKFQVSTFVEQVVEDESQMEGLLGNCSSIMVWRLPLESSSSSYPHQWVISRNVEKQLTSK